MGLKLRTIEFEYECLDLDDGEYCEIIKVKAAFNDDGELMAYECRYLDEKIVPGYKFTKKDNQGIELQAEREYEKKYL